MGHYDLNCVMIDMSALGGVSRTGGRVVGPKQEQIAKELKNAFGYDFNDSEKVWKDVFEGRAWDIGSKIGLNEETLKELAAFVSGEHLGIGGKGHFFSYCHVANYREIELMAEDWIKITTKCPNTFPRIILFAVCESELAGPPRSAVVINGQIHYDKKFWDFGQPEDKIEKK